jgi:hypothetical protein
MVDVQLHAAELAVSEFIPAVGLVAMRWTQVEHATTRLLALIANVPQEMEAALAIHIPDRTAFDIILAMAQEWKLPDGLPAYIDAVSKAHDAHRENRNLLVHGLYMASEPEIEPKRFALQRVTARRRTKITYYEISPAEVFKQSARIFNFAGVMQRLGDHLDALRKQLQPPELLPTPPQPDKLTKTLPQLTVHDLMRPRPFGRGYTGWGEPLQEQ